MRGRSWLILMACVGCGRTEEPARPVATTQAPSTPAPAEVPRPSPKPRCVVPSAAEPPPPVSRAPRCPVDPDEAPTLPRGVVRFPQAPAAPEVDAELARTPEHRERGLMYRTELGENAGMLFSWRDEQPRGFWMRNTCVPLDMLFIAADGTIVGILENVPVLNEAPRTVECPAMHVLEVNAGWTRRRGVRAGQTVELPPKE